MTVKDFKYDNIKLSDYKMMSCDPDEEQSFVSRVIDKGTQTAIRSNPTHFTTHYEDTLKLYFLIVRDECEVISSTDYILSENEINELNSWLSSPKKPIKLEVETDSGISDVTYTGLFTDVQPFVLNHECYGLKATFTCDSPYGYRIKETSSYSMYGSIGYDADINNSSSEKYEYIYPTIVITPTMSSSENSALEGGETFTLKNNRCEGHLMKIVLGDGIIGKKRIEIDCGKRSVVDEDGNPIPLGEIGIQFENGQSNLLMKDNEIFWLKLFHGDNRIRITSYGEKNFKVKLLIKEPVKVGGFNV